jgi:thiol-disulfide isomerase/thioredoxin
MRTAAVLLVLAVSVSAAASVSAQPAAPAATPYAIGATVPGDVTLKDIFGKEHRLADYRGKIVFIHFWSIVCPYEKLAEPKAIELQKAYADKGVVQIAINANQKELAAGGEQYTNLREHVEKAGVTFLVTVDPGNKITDLFGGKSTPHCFIVDRNGVLQYSGALDDDPKGAKGAGATSYVKNALDALLAGQPVAQATTSPYG